MCTLKDQGLIHVDLSCPRWTFDLDKIAELKISETVVTLLSSEMKKLGSDLQLGLAVASCLGSRVKLSVLDLLSKDLHVDLESFLLELVEKGFMDKSGEEFRFAHDKIEEGTLGAISFFITYTYPCSVLTWVLFDFSCI